MKREIKFRAWSNARSIMELVNINDGKCVRNGYQWFSKDNDMHDSEPMQYTGLKDKNGVEIYEGDIVEYCNGEKGKVIFHFGVFCAYNGFASSSDEAYLRLSPEECVIDGFEFEIEVIGNIHQNLELLNEKV